MSGMGHAARRYHTSTPICDIHMRLNHPAGRLFPVALFLGVIGCTSNSSPPPGTVCTLIGCEDGLAVEITGDRTVPIDVTVKGAGQDARTFECADPDQPCRTFLAGYMPSEVTVTVSTSDGQESTETFAPTYETTYPNGPDCPPGCEQATVKMSV